MLGRAAEREAVEDVVGDRPARRLVVAGPEAGAHVGEQRRRHVDRGVELGHHVEVHRHLRPRPGARPVAVLVDHRHGAEHDAHRARIAPDRLRSDRDVRAHHAHHRRVGAAADLHLVGDATGEGAAPAAPGADQQRHRGPLDRVAQHRARGESEHLAVDPCSVAAQQRGHDRGGLAEGGQRARLGDTDRPQPRSARQAEVGPPARRRVDGGDLPGDLDRVQRERVEARRTEPHPGGRRGDLEQGRQRRLEHQVGEHADHVDAVGLGVTGERGVGARRLVALQPDADLGGHAGSVTSGRSGWRSEWWWTIRQPSTPSSRSTSVTRNSTSAPPVPATRPVAGQRHPVEHLDELVVGRQRDERRRPVPLVACVR